MITKYILSYFLTALVFFGIDMVWLGVVAKNFYQEQIGGLMKSPVNWPAAVIFYLLYVVAVLVLIVFPHKAQGWLSVLFYGAFFGFICYATYDLTNLATLKNWPLTVVIVDILWGTILTGLVSLAGYFIVKWIF